MSMKAVRMTRKTRETDITLALNMSVQEPVSIATGVPFFDHMLHAMSFHGGFSLDVKASGDIDVDPHHLVEDVGLVLGDALRQWVENNGAVMRFGQSVIPMDDALSEVVIDVCERPFLVFDPEWPQTHAGVFDLELLREFLTALSSRARINLHCSCRYGKNGHHMAESLFKALGKAVSQAYSLKAGGRESMSTKGVL